MAAIGALVFPSFVTTKPPFDPASLHEPLTAAQRSEIINWVEQFKGTFPAGTLQSASDTYLIQYYGSVYTAEVKGYHPTGSPIGNITGAIGGTIGEITSPVTSALDFLTSTETWIRIGEFVVGAIILGVGLKYILGDALGGGSGGGSSGPRTTVSASSARKTLKTIAETGAE